MREIKLEVTEGMVSLKVEMWEGIMIFWNGRALEGVEKF